MKTLDDIKNEVAVKYGYEDYKAYLRHIRSVDDNLFFFGVFMEEVAKEYALYIQEETIKVCTENAELRLKNSIECDDSELEGGYKISGSQSHIIVNKKSILNTKIKLL